jgi:hypothetical protein
MNKTTENILKYTLGIGALAGAYLIGSLDGCSCSRNTKEEVKVKQEVILPPIKRDNKNHNHSKKNKTIDDTFDDNNDDNNNTPDVIIDNRYDSNSKRNKQEGCTYQNPNDKDLLLFYSGAKGKQQGTWYENHDGYIRTIAIDTKKDNVFKWPTVSSVKSLDEFMTYFGKDYTFNGKEARTEEVERQREEQNKKDYAEGYKPKSGFSKGYLKNKTQHKGQ